MKKITPLLLAVAVLFAFTASFIVVTDAATTIEQDIAELNKIEEQKKATAAQRAELKKKIEALQGQYENNYHQKLILENSIQLAEAEIQTVESLIAGYEARLTELANEQYERQKELDEYYEIYGKILTYYYKYGNASSLEILLSSNGIADFLTRLDYLKYIMEYNNTITDSIKLAKENAEATAKLYAESQSKLTAEKEGLLATKAEYASQCEELEKLNEDIAGNMELTDKQMQELQQFTQQLEKEILELNQQISDKKVFTETTYAWPIDSVYWSDPNVVITSPYVHRINPITGKEENHKGIDIKAPRGTPIQVVKSGIVTRSENALDWGNVIVVSHGDGTSTLYAHCDKLLVEKGKTVTQGQVIAKVGSTGQSNGYHLHFAIYKGSSTANPTVNPADYLDEVFLNTLNKRGLALR